MPNPKRSEIINFYKETNQNENNEKYKNLACRKFYLKEVFEYIKLVNEKLRP